MKKTIVILSVTLITLTATLAFKSKSDVAAATTAKDEKVANNGSGFALQDQDQWK
jgi:hypothetical protein